MTLLPVLTSSLMAGWAITHEPILAGWAMSDWTWLTVVLTLGSGLGIVPPTFLALVFGYFIGWTSLPLLFSLNMGAIALVYGLARWIQPAGLLEYLQAAYPKVQRLLLRFRGNQLRLIFFAKLSPVLPFAVVNLLFSLAGASFRKILLGGAMGMVPRTLMAVWAGTQAREIRYLLENPNEGVGAQVLLLVLLLVSTVGIGWFFRDKEKSTSAES
ncbi:hypothetical protein GCM10027275_27960 [Rhabdobacter roseus]